MNIDEKPRKSGCYSGGSLRLEARLLHHLLALLPQVLAPTFGDLPALPMNLSITTPGIKSSICS